MKRYKNLSGNSGILAYDTGKDLIRVKFSDNEIYVYTWKNPGKALVEKMKTLAEKGKGLATFINKYVRENYDHKE